MNLKLESLPLPSTNEHEQRDSAALEPRLCNGSEDELGELVEVSFAENAGDVAKFQSEVRRLPPAPFKPVLGSDGLYRCGFADCPVVRPALWSIRQHQNVHLELFECRHCRKCFETSANLARHELAHSENASFSCCVCQRKFKDNEHLRRHLGNANCRPAESFKQAKKRIYKRRNCKIEPSESAEAIFRCGECHKLFVNRWELDAHQRRGLCVVNLLTEHGAFPPMFPKDPDQSFYCAVCKTQFVKMANLLRHVLRKSCPVPYPRKRKAKTRSGKGGRRRRFGVDHVFQCPGCAKVFSNNDHLQRHTTFALCGRTCGRPKKPRPPPRLPPSGSRKKEAYACDWPGCTVVKKTSSKLSQHKNIHRRKFVCDRCGRCWQDGHDLRKHQAKCKGEAKPEKRTFQCHLCPMLFERVSLLGAHLRTHFEGVRVEPKFTRRHYDWKPLVASNSEELPTPSRRKPLPKSAENRAIANEIEALLDKEDCSGNASSSVEADSRKDADATVVKTEQNACKPSVKRNRVYKCDWPGCDVVKATGSELRKHLNVHEQRFKCPECNTRFESAYELGRHVANVHAQGQFQCSKCFVTFRYKKELRSHMTEHEELEADLEGHVADTSAAGLAEVKGDPGPEREEPAGIFPCDWAGCSVVRFSKFSLALHKNIHWCKYPCVGCAVCFQSFKELRAHMLVCSKAADVMAQEGGPSADERSADEQTASNSVEQSEDEEMGQEDQFAPLKPVALPPAFTCSACDLVFPDVSEQREHNIKFHGRFQNIFKCGKCTQSFPHFNDLMAHHKTHRADAKAIDLANL